MPLDASEIFKAMIFWRKLRILEGIRGVSGSFFGIFELCNEVVLRWKLRILKGIRGTSGSCFGIFDLSKKMIF